MHHDIGVFSLLFRIEMEGEIKKTWHGIDQGSQMYPVCFQSRLIEIRSAWSALRRRTISLVVFLFYASNSTQILPPISFSGIMSRMEPTRLHFFFQKSLLVEIFFSGM